MKLSLFLRPMESVTCSVCLPLQRYSSFSSAPVQKGHPSLFPAPVFIASKTCYLIIRRRSSAQISDGAPAAHFLLLYHLNPSQYHVFDGSWLIFMLFCSSACLAFIQCCPSSRGGSDCSISTAYSSGSSLKHHLRIRWMMHASTILFPSCRATSDKK